MLESGQKNRGAFDWQKGENGFWRCSRLTQTRNALKTYRSGRRLLPPRRVTGLTILREALLSRNGRARHKSNGAAGFPAAPFDVSRKSLLSRADAAVRLGR